MSIRHKTDYPSYYKATANPHPSHPALQGDIKADVCVVGGGYTGLSAALELVERGYDVVVLESETIGYGASGRNGGQVCTGFTKGMETIEARIGKDLAKAAWEIADEAPKLVKERVNRYGIDCDLKWGYTHLANKPEDLEDFKEAQESWSRYGYSDTRIDDKAALQARLASRIYHGGLFEKGAGHLHPLNYCLGLAEAAQKTGARIFEHSEVTRIDKGPAPKAYTLKGRVDAKFLVLAGNAYMGNLVPMLHRRIMPVGSYILATEPLGDESARAIIRDDDAFCDSNFVVDYFRLSGDKRMLFGGRCTYSGKDPDDMVAFMKPKLLKVFPQLENTRIDHYWGGFIGITMDRMPHLGTIGPNIYFAQGFSGHGLALSGICGKLIAEAVSGTAERFDVMTRFKHPVFPGGYFRTPILMLGMLYYQLRDILR